MEMIEVRGSPAAIRRAYDFFSYFYEFTVSNLERRAIARGLEKAHALPGEHVLEVAVGTGASFKNLREQAGEKGLAVGLDLAPRMLARTRRHVPQGNLIQADARSLPFAPASFDILFSSYFLDLIPTEELADVLEEFHRVLRPGGRLLLVDFSKEGDKLTLWERIYVHSPQRIVPYVFGSCRPIRIEPFVHEAGFVSIEREFLPGGMSSEILLARKD
ncbi:MAG: class I SAM-dependent methyltransferase [Candidatus Acidiferrum sp.]